MDISAKFPAPILNHLREGGKTSDFKYKPEFLAKFNDQCFIYCVATLPLKDFDSDLGFGLWVEVSNEDFNKYLDAIEQENGDLYKNFESEGTLANDWPLFKGTYGDKVKIKVVDENSKVRIVDIDASEVELRKYIEPVSLDEAQKEILRNRLAVGNIDTRQF